MIYIHLSPVFNRDSILRNGIVPTKINNLDHLNTFIKDDACTKDEKAIYAWQDCEKNEKYIKDLIYAKVFIHPRNTLVYDYYDKYNDCLDFSKFHEKPIYKTSAIYDVYEINTSSNDYMFIHTQQKNRNEFHSCFKLHDEYSHDDKLMTVFKEPQRNIKIIGRAEYYYHKNKMNIRVL